MSLHPALRIAAAVRREEARGQHDGAAARPADEAGLHTLGPETLGHLRSW